MALKIHQAFFTDERLQVWFCYRCDACEREIHVQSQLTVRFRENPRTLSVPDLPASWRQIEARHYCEQHRIISRVTVQPSQTQALPLTKGEGEPVSDPKSKPRGRAGKSKIAVQGVPEVPGWRCDICGGPVNAQGGARVCPQHGVRVDAIRAADTPDQ